MNKKIKKAAKKVVKKVLDKTTIDEKIMENIDIGGIWVKQKRKPKRKWRKRG